MIAKLSQLAMTLGTVAVLGASAAIAADVTVIETPTGPGGFSDIHAGITKDEVRDLVGKPVTVLDNELPGLTLWIYEYTDAFGYKTELDLYFDTHDRVTKIQSLRPQS